MSGLLTAEKPDLDNEVCDYEGSKPYFKALAERYLKITSAVAGMQPSLFPVREMHQLKAVGAGRSISFNDNEKTITISAEVVEPDAVTKVQKGVLIGFSQGGSYVGEPVPDPDFPGCMRYISDPGEASLVDAPCLPDALIDSIKEKTFVYRKNDGSMELVKFHVEKKTGPVNKAKGGDTKKKSYAGEQLSKDCFAYVGDPEEPATWQIPIKLSTPEKTKTALRAGLVFFDDHVPDQNRSDVRKTLFRAVKAAGIDVADDLSKLQDACSGFQKGLSTVTDMACCLQTMTWVQDSVTWEREMEGDDSKMPEELADLLDHMVQCFVDLVEEETNELLEAAHRGKGAKAMTTELEKAQAALKDKEAAIAKAADDLKKAADKLLKAKSAVKDVHVHLGKAVAHQEKMADHHDKLMDHHDKMRKTHDELAEHHEQHAGVLTEALKAAEAVDGGADKASGGPEILGVIKTAKAGHDKMHKMHKGLGEMHGKMADHHTKAADMHKTQGGHLAAAYKAAQNALDDETSNVDYGEKGVHQLDLTKALSGSEEFKELMALSKANAEAITALTKSAAEEPASVKTLRETIEKQTKELAELKAATDPTLRVKYTLIPRPGEKLGEKEPVSVAASGNVKDVGF